MNEADGWCSETRVVKDEGCDCQGCESEKTTQAMGPWDITACPECGQVTDIDYSGVAYSDMCPECRCAPGAAHAAECPEYALLMAKGYREMAEHALDTADAYLGMADVDENGTMPLDEFREGLSPEVPFFMQSWCFEELATAKLDELHDLIDDYGETIIEMARDRFRKGYAKYGSTMYGWTAEERLQNVLEELSDAVVYLTSGPVT